MEALQQYFISNFFLICLSISTIVMVLRSYRTKRGITVLMPVLVVSSVLLLSIVYAVEMYAKSAYLYFLATFCCALGFIIRPFVLYFFMRISIDKENNKALIIIALSLIGLNAIVYILSLFTFATEMVKVIFYYAEIDGVLEVIRGPLFYTSHFIVGIMMAYFIIRSISQLKGRRKIDAIASLICAGFVGVAVVLESFLIADNLLNTTVAIACLFYVVHLYQQALIHDPLTNLFDRKAYYSDLEKIKSKITGVIVVDMNALKELNDAQGHEAGDTALITIATAILKSMRPKSMYGYRMGGDEFIIVSLSKKEYAVETVANRILEEMKKTPYTVSIGYATRTNMESKYSLLVKEADMMMYKNKEEYYLKSGKDRRHRREQI